MYVKWDTLLSPHVAILLKLERKKLILEAAADLLFKPALAK